MNAEDKKAYIVRRALADWNTLRPDGRGSKEAWIALKLSISESEAAKWIGKAEAETKTVAKEATEYRLYIQEILNDLERNGYVQHGKAQQLLRDWSLLLRDKAPRTRGRVRRIHAVKVGTQHY